MKKLFMIIAHARENGDLILPLVNDSVFPPVLDTSKVIVVEFLYEPLSRKLNAIIGKDTRAGVEVFDTIDNMESLIERMAQEIKGKFGTTITEEQKRNFRKELARVFIHASE